MCAVIKKEMRMIWGRQQTKPTSVNLVQYVGIGCHIFAGYGGYRSAGIMACKEQREDVVLHLLIGERFSPLIPIVEKAREDVRMLSVPPSLIDPYLQVLSYRIRSCQGFTICCSWDVEWQQKHAFHHGLEELMEHIFIFSVPSTNQNLTSYGEHELLHEVEESNLRFALEMISYECKRDMIDTARVSLQGFGAQEHHERIPYARDTMCSTPDDGIVPEKRDHARRP